MSGGFKDNGARELEADVHLSPHRTYISIGVAVGVGIFVFMAGAAFSRLNQIDPVRIETRLIRLELLAQQIAIRVGVPIPAHETSFKATATAP